MFSEVQYLLLDFGQGRKLERFGSIVLDRPAPAAEGLACANKALWSTAHARYQRGTAQDGRWHGLASIPKQWEIQHGSMRLELRPTPFGHVGVFIEQAANWDWLARQVAAAGRSLRVLNLFAYTGGSTLAAAAAGCQVTHVDAAANTVAWARQNAALSGLAGAPIRWIVDDARAFVARELKRGRTYDAVVLDPPTYGHGPQGETWKLFDDLPPLLKACGKLTSSQRSFFLLSCHAPGLGPAELSAYLAEALFGHCSGGGAAHEMKLISQDGRKLASGVVARWP